MTTPQLAWPDATLVTVNYLRAAFSGLSTGTYPSITGMRVGRVLPKDLAMPFTRVGRVGGPIDEVYDDARLLVESFDTTADDVATNAGLVRDLMRLMPGVRDGFKVVRVVEVGGPASIADEQTNLPRNLATYSVRFRANART